MRRRRRSISLAACLLAVALPGGALGQTPGDDQYTDPFGGSQDEGAAPDSGEEAAPAPTAAPAPAPPTAPVPAEADATPSPAAEQLPYTGSAAGLAALGGSVLLAGGVALRLRLRSG